MDEGASRVQCEITHSYDYGSQAQPQDGAGPQYLSCLKKVRKAERKYQEACQRLQYLTSRYYNGPQDQLPRLIAQAKKDLNAITLSWNNGVQGAPPTRGE